MQEQEKGRPTVGYNAKGEPKTFELKQGEKLPAGWSDTPPKGTHPHDRERGIAPETDQAAPKGGGKGKGQDAA